MTIKTYTRKETAELLKMSERTLDRYIRSGKIKATKTGTAKRSKVIITAAAINEFLEENTK